MSELKTGVRNERTIRVGPEHSPDHLAPIVVLATPTMIQVMEQVSTDAVQPHLEDHQTTVGTHVDVSHESAAREGDVVTVSAELVTVDEPRLVFHVEARVGERVIGRGTHRRHVIDASRFAG